MKPEHHAPVTELLVNTFSTREPLGAGIRIRKEDIYAWAPRIVDELINQKVYAYRGKKRLCEVCIIGEIYIHRPTLVKAFCCIYVLRCHAPNILLVLLY